MPRKIARYTLDGVNDADVTVHPFTTEDNLGLELRRFHRAECDDVVLIVHGLTSSSDMFIMPEHDNLVNFLLDSGFTDVWTSDFRMSCRFPYDTETHRYTLDDIAHYDHPAAVRELRRFIGDRRLHVIAHCLGSVSFSMSLFGGLIDGVSSLVSNSVSLTPRVPAWSRVKLALGPALCEYVVGTPFLDSRFGDAPPFTRGWMISRAVSLFHHECDVRACHMESFMWGSGRPAMYVHDNLDPVTHERIADLLGPTGMNYFRHVRKMVRSGQAVRYDPRDSRHSVLPDDYFANAGEITTPVLFLTGDRNHVFPQANVVCFETLDKLAPGRHELEILPGYGHFDPFTGKRAHVDVFPRVVDFLKRSAA